MTERVKILKANLRKLRKAQDLLSEVKHIVLSDDASRFVSVAELEVNEAINECETCLHDAEEAEETL